MKRRFKLKSLLPYLIYATIGIALGFVIGYIGFRGGADDTAPESLSVSAAAEFLSVSFMLALCCLSVFLHTILHEAGHLLCGLLSGYKFVSFNVAGLMFIRKEGKLKVKRYRIAGVAGQCLMCPPKLINGRYPFLLYNLGGSLTNLIFSCVSITLFIVFRDTLHTYADDMYIAFFIALANVMFIAFAFIGAFFGLTNILPITINGLSTDGRNIVSLRKSEQSRRALWILLTANARLTMGERGKDLPEEWFHFPDDYNYNDTISANVAAYKIYALIDRHDFKEAKAIAESVLTRGDKLIELLKNDIRCELLFLNIIEEPRNMETIKELYTPKLQRCIKASKTQISKHRLTYAYERLVSKDAIKARQALDNFNKTCPTYPYAGSCDCERELIAVIDSLADTGAYA